MDVETDVNGDGTPRGTVTEIETEAVIDSVAVIETDATILHLPKVHEYQTMDTVDAQKDPWDAMQPSPHREFIPPPH